MSQPDSRFQSSQTDTELGFNGNCTAAMQKYDFQEVLVNFSLKAVVSGLQMTLGSGSFALIAELIQNVI